MSNEDIIGGGVLLEVGEFAYYSARSVLGLGKGYDFADGKIDLNSNSAGARIGSYARNHGDDPASLVRQVFDKVYIDSTTRKD